MIPGRSAEPGELLERIKADRASLARALTAVDSGIGAAPVLAAIGPALGHARTVGITGPPGAGKSTLINALVGSLRTRGATVAVIAVDPSSPISGGSILGDRVRMTDHHDDDGVFIRSVPSRGGYGGLALNSARLIDLFDAAGYDWVLVETVGAGQSEVEIADLAGATVLVCAPGLGDDVQAIKSGVLEVADLIVVNKSDHPLAQAALEQFRSASTLRPDRAAIPVLSTQASTGEGVDGLADHLSAMVPKNSRSCSLERARVLVARSAARRMERKLSTDRTIDELCERVRKGELDADQAAAILVPADDE